MNLIKNDGMVNPISEIQEIARDRLVDRMLAVYDRDNRKVFSVGRRVRVVDNDGMPYAAGKIIGVEMITDGVGGKDPAYTVKYKIGGFAFNRSLPEWLIEPVMLEVVK